MKNFTYTTIFIIALATQAVAQDAPIFPKGEKAPNVHHTGTVWLNELSQADDTFNYNVSQATFEPGSKLDWHAHPGGQILLITDGAGYYQERDKPVKTVHKGDVIKCLPGVEHWHASTPKSAFTYIATTMNHPKGRTIWLESVAEKEYLNIIPKTYDSAEKE
jgi:4-carboxymuconolactone decarboxylase